MFLKWPKVKNASQLVQNCLLEKDLGSASAIVMLIDKYFAGPAATSDSSVLLEELAEIETPGARPKWNMQMKRWVVRFSPAADPNKPQETGN